MRLRLRTPDETELPPLPLDAIHPPAWRRRVALTPAAWVAKIGQEQEWLDNEQAWATSQRVPILPADEMRLLFPKAADGIEADLMADQKAEDWRRDNPEALAVSIEEALRTARPKGARSRLVASVT